MACETSMPWTPWRYFPWLETQTVYVECDAGPILITVFWRWRLRFRRASGNGG